MLTEEWDELHLRKDGARDAKQQLKVFRFHLLLLRNGAIFLVVRHRRCEGKREHHLVLHRLPPADSRIEPQGSSVVSIGQDPGFDAVNLAASLKK